MRRGNDKHFASARAAPVAFGEKAVDIVMADCALSALSNTQTMRFEAAILIG